MNFDPITRAKEEQEDFEENLKKLVDACAGLSNVLGQLKPESDAFLTASDAFGELWDEALKYTDAVSLYKMIERKVNS